MTFSAAAPKTYVENRKQIAVWALPAAVDGAVLSSVLAGLASEFQAPYVEPHLALAQGKCRDKEELQRLLDAVAAGRRSFRLRLKGPEHFITNDFATLVLPCEMTDALADLCDALKCSLLISRVEPHLVLVQKDLTFHQRSDLASRLQIPLTQVTFDGLRIVSSESSVWTNPSEWRTGQKIELK